MECPHCGYSDPEKYFFELPILMRRKKENIVLNNILQERKMFACPICYKVFITKEDRNE